MGCPLRSKTNTAICPVLVTKVFCFPSVMYRIPRSLEEKGCFYDSIRKNQNSDSNSKKILFPPPLFPLKNGSMISTISAKRNQTSYTNGQKPHQVLLADKPSAS